MSVVLINFEGILDENQRNSIEDAINSPIYAVRNIMPYPPEDVTIEDYIFTVIRNILDPENDWDDSSFIVRFPDSQPIFTALFIAAFEKVSGASLAVLDLRFTNAFPPIIDQAQSKIIPMHAINQKARQIRYSLAD